VRARPGQSSRAVKNHDVPALLTRKFFRVQRRCVLVALAGSSHLRPLIELPRLELWNARCSVSGKGIVSMTLKSDQPLFIDTEANRPDTQRGDTQQHRNLERLAYAYWQERGSPYGSPLDDWTRAERDYETLRHTGMGA
jgi:Protein of unknown function (DUF2934)